MSTFEDRLRTVDKYKIGNNLQVIYFQWFVKTTPKDKKSAESVILSCGTTINTLFKMA
jgi:hypothetical protein